jgi:hypothetical protein
MSCKSVKKFQGSWLVLVGGAEFMPNLLFYTLNRFLSPSVSLVVSTEAKVLIIGPDQEKCTGCMICTAMEVAKAAIPAALAAAASYCHLQQLLSSICT